MFERNGNTYDKDFLNTQNLSNYQYLSTAKFLSFGLCRIKTHRNLLKYFFCWFIPLSPLMSPLPVLLFVALLPIVSSTILSIVEDKNKV